MLQKIVIGATYIRESVLIEMSRGFKFRATMLLTLKYANVNFVCMACRNKLNVTFKLYKTIMAFHVRSIYSVSFFHGFLVFFWVVFIFLLRSISFHPLVHKRIFYKENLYPLKCQEVLNSGPRCCLLGGTRVLSLSASRVVINYMLRSKQIKY